jgi:hypothetical protein
MIIKSLINVYDRKNKLVDCFEYERPVTKEIKLEMKEFCELNNFFNPGCTFECINYKDKDVKINLPDAKKIKSDLFSIVIEIDEEIENYEEIKVKIVA